MRKTLTYLAVSFYSFFFFACEQGEMEVPMQTKLVKIPIAVEIATGDQSRLSTKATEEELAGTCNVDKILLLVYSGATGLGDRRALTFHSQQVVDCAKEGDRWVARGSINGAANTNYSVFALGYNSGETGFFQILPVPLQAGVTAYKDTRVALTYTGGASTTRRGFHTPEFFAGNVLPKDGTSDVFTADGETGLTGTLYRAVGKCVFTLTNIPANIKKIAWLTEKIADYNLLYRVGANGAVFSKYPMGVPETSELRKYVSEVASVENTGNTEWEAALTSFFIPLNGSLFYIEATDTNGLASTYLVKCADHYSDSIWIEIMGYGVTSYRFVIPPNYQISVSGSFDQLKNSGNVLIDLSEIGEYEGGLLS